MKIFTVLGGRSSPNGLGRGYAKYPHTVTAENFRQAAEIVKKLGLVGNDNEVVLVQGVRSASPNDWHYHDGDTKITYDISGSTPVVIGRHGRMPRINPRRRKTKYRVRKNFKKYSKRHKTSFRKKSKSRSKNRR